MRVMAQICSNFCRGKPSTKASNWGCVNRNVSGADPAGNSLGHTKQPRFKRRTARQTPSASCMRSLMRCVLATDLDRGRGRGRNVMFHAAKFDQLHVGRCNLKP